MDPRNKPVKIQEETSRPVFFLIPQQKQNLVYSVQQIQQSAPLVVAPQPKAALVYATVQEQNAPLVAVPQSEIIQNARLQVLPASAQSSSIFTPFSASLVQVYQ